MGIKNELLSIDFVDMLVRDRLISDYKDASAGVTDLKSRAKLKSFEKEDLKNYTKLRNALKVVISYYFTKEEADEILK